jgi:Protein of unknown function (DUF2783)
MEDPMTPLRTDLQFSAPDDVYEAIISLGDGLDERAAHTALAAFALLLANHIGDDKVVHAAIASVRQTLKDYPEAPKLGGNDPDRKQFQVGGALDSLRKIIEVKPAPTIPGALTS